MTWPQAIRTAELVFRVVRDATGDPLPTTVTIQPEFGGPQRLQHVSGAVLTADPDRALIRAGQERRIPIPMTDQAGWTDPTGAPFTGWAYTVTAVIGLARKQQRVVVHHLQPVTETPVIVLTDVPVDDQPGVPTVGQLPVGFEVEFSDPLATWTIPHALGRRPSVALYDEHGVAMDTDVESSLTLTVVTFPEPTAGSAVLT